MKNNLMIFEGNKVEVILGENGEPLFELYSTGMALGYVKNNTVKGKVYYQCRKDRVDKTLEKAEIKPLVHNGLIYLTEEQLYDFMLEARTDKCKTFKKWVTHEVLPQIRKTIKEKDTTINIMKSENEQLKNGIEELEEYKTFKHMINSVDTKDMQLGQFGQWPKSNTKLYVIIIDLLLFFYCFIFIFCCLYCLL